VVCLSSNCWSCCTRTCSRCGGETVGGEIISLDVTSNVTQRGQYSQLQQIAISCTPIVVNSAVAVGVAAGAMWIPNSPVEATVIAQVGVVVLGEILVVVLQVVFLLLAFSLAAAALLSYQDAKSPYQLFRHHIANPTLKRLLTIPLAVPLLLVFLIPLGFTYFRCKSLNFRLIGRVSSRVCLWCSQLRGHSSLLFWLITGAVRR